MQNNRDQTRQDSIGLVDQLSEQIYGYMFE